MDHIENGKAETFSEFFDKAVATLEVAYKDFVVGAATVGTGRFFKGRGAPVTVQVASEATVMSSVGSFLEGRGWVPSRQEVEDAALAILGLRAAVRIGREPFTQADKRLTKIYFDKLSKAYRDKGKLPREMVQDMKDDPSIQHDTMSDNLDSPRAYRDPAATASSRPVGELPPPEPIGPQKMESIASKEVVAEEAPPFRPVLDALSINAKELKLPMLVRGNEAVHRLYTDYVNELHPMARAFKAMADGQEISIVEDFYRLARLDVAQFVKATSVIDHGALDFHALERVSESQQFWLDSVEGRVNDLREYMVSARAVEVAERGIDIGIPMKDGVDLKTGRIGLGAISVVQSADPKIVAAAEGMVKYRQEVLKYFKDSGMINQQEFDNMIELGASYVPIHRLLMVDSSGGVKTDANVRKALFNLEGGQLKIIDPLETDIKNTYMLMAIADKNAINNAFVNMVEGSGDIGKTFATKTKVGVTKTTIREGEVREVVGRIQQLTGKEVSQEQLSELSTAIEGTVNIFRENVLTPGKNQIAVFRNGEREVWTINDSELARAFEGTESWNPGAGGKFMKFFGSGIRVGAIWTPEFQLPNIGRDQLSAYMFSDSGYIPFYHYTRGVMEMAEGTRFSSKEVSDMHKRYLASGAPMAEWASLDRDYLQKNIRQLTKETGLTEDVHNLVKSPITLMSMAVNISEQGTRRGSFMQGMKRRGISKEAILESGFESRENSLDFARIGAKMHAVNAVVPFSNLTIQGTDKIVRAFKDNPKRTMAKLMPLVLGTMALHYANTHDSDPEAVKEYYRINKWQRDNFWVFSIGEGVNRQWHRIAKPHSLGVLFATGTERMMDWVVNEDPKAFDGFWDSLVASVQPGVVPAIAVPVVEQWSGRVIFTDAPLMNARTERLLPEMQYKPYTTEFAKALGRSVSQIPGFQLGDDFETLSSPIIIENYVRAWTGGLGRHALNLVDKALREAGVLPDPPKPADTLADLPVIKAFTIRHPSAGAQPIQDFWDLFTRNERILATINFMRAEGNMAADLHLSRIYGDALHGPDGNAESIRNMAQFIRRVSNLPEDVLDKHQKRQFIDNQYMGMILSAEQGVEQLLRLEEQRGELAAMAREQFPEEEFNFTSMQQKENAASLKRKAKREKDEIDAKRRFESVTQRQIDESQAPPP